MMTHIIVFLGLILLFVTGYFIGLFFGIGEGLKDCRKKKKKSKYPKCDSTDVNDCYKWCNAKNLFKKDSDHGLV
jgi:hypothetical protein